MAQTPLQRTPAGIDRRTLLRRSRVDGSLPPLLQTALHAGKLDSLISEGVLLQAKPRCTVSRIDFDDQTLLVKRHTWGDLGRTLRMAHRTSSARKCFNLGQKLAAWGVPTPMPRAYVEDRIGSFGYRSYLITDYQPGRSLFHCLRNEQPAPVALADLAQQVATIWQRLIDLGISHNDLKPENFIVDEAQKVWLIDMEKMRLRCSSTKLIAQHLNDARSFFHVRNWRYAQEAAEAFRGALLTTQLGKWVASEPEHPMNRSGFAHEELSQRISVAIISADPAADREEIHRSESSVADFADEVAIVRPMTLGGRFIVDTPTGPQVSNLQHPWVLVVRAGECVPPDLSRLLTEYVVDQPLGPPMRIEVEELIAGCRVPLSDPTTAARLFRQHDAVCVIDQGAIALKGEFGEESSVEYKLQRTRCATVAEYRSQVEAAARRAAWEQFEQGERPRHLSSVTAAAGQWLRSLLGNRLAQQGVRGVRVAWESAKFEGIRQARMKQLCADPQLVEQQLAAEASLPTPAADPTFGRDQTSRRAA